MFSTLLSLLSAIRLRQNIIPAPHLRATESIPIFRNVHHGFGWNEVEKYWDKGLSSTELLSWMNGGCVRSKWRKGCGSIVESSNLGIFSIQKERLSQTLYVSHYY